MTVHFIGAGPGDPDLITVRGRDLIAAAPVVLYAGSLVPPQVVAFAPPGAWRGDLIMAGATLCMALYSVFGRPLIGRSSALGFLAGGMSVGGGALILLSLATGRLMPLATFNAANVATTGNIAVQ